MIACVYINGRLALVNDRGKVILNYYSMCSAVSLDQLGTDVRVMAETFQMAMGELVKDQDNIQLREFVIETEEKVNDLKDRFQMAEDTYHKVVRFYGEDPKATEPGPFFNEFARFIAAYKVSVVGAADQPTKSDRLVLLGSSPLSFAISYLTPPRPFPPPSPFHFPIPLIPSSSATITTIIFTLCTVNAER